MRQLSFLLMIMVVVATSCTKEKSYENGKSPLGNAEGSLLDNAGNCQDIVVNGNYQENVPLTDNNFIWVKLNVTTQGQYIIYTDTSNGFWFRDTGYVSLGSQLVKIKGHGKPILPLDASFTIFFDNSECSFTVPYGNNTPVGTGDYFPTTIGSNWRYNDGSADSIHIEAINKDTTISGNTYRILVQTQAGSSDSSFYRKSGGSYFTWSTVDITGVSTPTPIEYIFLKDDQPAGSTWESPEVPVSGIPNVTKVKAKFTIVSVGGTTVVSGNTFSNIIRVQQEIQYQTMGVYVPAFTVDAYYSKGVGLVNASAPTLSLTQQLERWIVY